MLGYVPSVAVGVVGIGHVPGIIANWNETRDVQKQMCCQLLQYVALVTDADFVVRLLVCSVLTIKPYECPYHQSQYETPVSCSFIQVTDSDIHHVYLSASHTMSWLLVLRHLHITC